ncbi:MAG: hypothetical protein J0I06_04180 [Planctomycetes bacterium]|nr:hypothetical protein [Planctomycetota bacterium]
MRLICFASVAALALAAGTATADEISNPEFEKWSTFKKGASITMKTTSTFGKNVSEVTERYTLVEVGPDKLVLEGTNVSKFNGAVSRAPSAKADVPKTITVPPGGAGKQKLNGGRPEGTIEEGTETLKVGGIEIKTRWYKYRLELGENKIEGKMWTSADVPGGLVKLESTTSGAVPVTVQMELVEFKQL